MINDLTFQLTFQTFYYVFSENQKHPINLINYIDFDLFLIQDKLASKSALGTEDNLVTKNFLAIVDNKATKEN